MNRVALIAPVLTTLACVSDSSSPSVEPSVAIVAEAPEPSAEVSPAPREEVVPEPPPAVETPPPVPNAEPAQLRVAVHGACRRMEMSFVDGQEFVHYGFDPIKIHRMDDRGAVAQTLTFNESIDIGYDFMDASQIRELTGRWPDQLVAVVDFSAREADTTTLFRLAGDDWTRVKPPRGMTDYHRAWPWHERSILALATNEQDETTPRLVVARGRPKGRSLAPLRRRGGCQPWDLRVGDVHPTDDGGLTLLADCKRQWLAHWAPGQNEPKLINLGPEDRASSLMLDERGEGYVAIGSDVMEWRGAALQPLALPGGEPPTAVGRGAQGRPWIRQDRRILQWTGEQWQQVTELPDGDKITVYGIDHQTPWLRRERAKGQQPGVAMMTADGRWHDVPLPAAPDLDSVHQPLTIHVVGPADAWVLTEYHQQNKRGRNIGRARRALYSTRPVPEARSCS